ncbi:unnamed protein product [Phaeothamnion confervicola]
MSRSVSEWKHPIAPSTSSAGAASRRCPRGQTPYDALHGHPPSTADFRPFGSGAYVHLLPHQRPAGGKFTQRAVMGVMMGCCSNGAGWRIYMLAARKVVTSSQVHFDEDVFPSTSLAGAGTAAGDDAIVPWPEVKNITAAAGGGGDVAPSEASIADAATDGPAGAEEAGATAGAGGGGNDGGRRRRRQRRQR